MVSQDFTSILSNFRKNMKEEDFIALLFVWWVVWLQQNRIIFDQEIINSIQTAHIANCSFKEWKFTGNLVLTLKCKDKT